MFCHNIPHQCLLSADNSQPITGVGPQVVLDRFITTNTRGQPQVIHQGRCVRREQNKGFSCARFMSRLRLRLNTLWPPSQAPLCVHPQSRAAHRDCLKITQIKLLILTCEGFLCSEFRQESTLTYKGYHYSLLPSREDKLLLVCVMWCAPQLRGATGKK